MIQNLVIYLLFILLIYVIFGAIILFIICAQYNKVYDKKINDNDEIIIFICWPLFLKEIIKIIAKNIKNIKEKLNNNESI